MLRIRSRRRGLTFAALALLVAGLAGAQSDPRRSAVEGGLLPRVVENGRAGQPVSLLQRMDELGVPGLSLAIIDGGEIAWTRGYGIMDLESKRPVTPDTLFLAGSISKPVSAMAALRLVQEGELTLDDDVNRWLRAWKVPPSEALGAGHVTLRQLLTHTAGLTVHGFPGYSRNAEIPTVPQILDGEEPANTDAVRVDLEPGSEWRYSGGGYTVMQLLVEDSTGEPFERHLAKTVLAPLGMSSSSFENPLPEARHALAASGHHSGEVAVAGGWHVYPEMAAAGLWTTATDLARFAIGVQRAAAGRSAVLDQETAGAMLTEHLGDWGLGPSLSGEGETRRFGHGGRDAGFDARLMAYVERGQGAAAMINVNDNAGFLTELFAAIARAYEWPDFPAYEQKEYLPLPETELRDYAARYTRDDGEGELQVFMWDEKLWISPRLGFRVQLLAEDRNGRFFLALGEGWVRFERDDEGAVTGIQFEALGAAGSARRQ